MCFGGSQTSTQTTSQNSSYTPAHWLSNAAQGNINFAQNLQSQGFQPFTGQQVADFSPQQQASFGQGAGIAGAVTPNVQLSATGLTDFLNKTGNAPTPITADSIASRMSPYMNNYVNLALAPQIAAANNQFAANKQLMQGQATSAGAFGDPRANILSSNMDLINNLSMQGLIGNAYGAAFNTAIGAGAQDVSNSVNAQIASGQQRLAQQGQNLAGINTAFGQGVTSTNLSNTLGSQQTAQNQARLNALYNQWLMAQQYPFQTTGLVNQTIGTATPAAPSTSNSYGTTQTSQPNNSGWGILGSLAGAALAPFTGGASLALGGLGTALGGMLSGGSSGMQTTSSMPFYGGGFSAPQTTWIGGNPYPMYAKGGRPKPNKPALVGEKGPELFVPDNTTFIPNSSTLVANNRNGKGMLHRAMGGPVTPGVPTMVGEKGPEMLIPNPNDNQKTQRLLKQWQAGPGNQNGVAPNMQPRPMPIQGGGLPTQLPLGIVPGAMAPAADAIVQPRPMGFGTVPAGGPMPPNSNSVTAISPVMPGPVTMSGTYNNVPTRARGGPVKQGQPTIVGENGPEVITPQQSGTVIPYHKLKAAIQKKKGIAMDGLSKQLGAA